MAMSYSHGAVQWLAASAVGASYNVTGLGFTPLGIRVWWVGLGSASDAVSETVNELRGMGFATGTAARRCVGSFSQDTAATSNCDTIARNDAIAVTTDGAGATNGLLDLSDVNSNGFTFIVDDQGVQDITVMWEAWGGADISVAAVGDISTPAAGGNQNSTVTGFVAGATDDQVVFFAGVQSTAALNTGFAEASGF